MNTCMNGCDRQVRAKGLCSRCYDRKRKPPGTTYTKVIPRCIYEGCESTEAKGYLRNRYCPEHFNLVLLDPATPITHRHLSKYGYVIVTALGKPHREHRLVMERHLGRRLTDRENVHHVDGNKENNTLENLELWLESQPSGQRVSDKITWALEIIERYGTEPNAF